MILEFYRDLVDAMWDKMYHETLKLNPDGTVSPPSVPGIGVNPYYEEFAPFRLA